MKRVICTLLAFFLLLSLAGCAAADFSSNTESKWKEQYDLGIRYLEEGDYQKAILAFDAAIEIDSRRPEAYAARADAYLAMGDVDKALKDYKKAKRVAARSDEDYESLIEELEEKIARIKNMESGFPTTESQTQPSGTSDIADGTYFAHIKPGFLDENSLRLYLWTEYYYSDEWDHDRFYDFCQLGYDGLAGGYSVTCPIIRPASIAYLENQKIVIKGVSMDDSADWEIHIEADGYVKYTQTIRPGYEGRYYGGTYEGYSAHLRFATETMIPLSDTCAFSYEQTESTASGDSAVVGEEISRDEAIRRVSDYTAIRITVYHGEITEMIITG